MKNIVNRGGPIEEDINKDKNSIYLSTDKKYLINNSNDKFSPLEASGNSIIVNSDKLIFNGRNGNVNIRASKNLVLEGDEVFINAKKVGTIKMGDPRAVFIPTINGQIMMEFMTEVIDVLNKGFSAIGKATNPPGLLSAAKDIAKIVGDQLPNILDIIKEKRFLNMDVMTADPNIELPELVKIPEIPKIPKVKLPDIPKPDISNIDVDMEKLETLEKIKNL